MKIDDDGLYRIQCSLIIVYSARLSDPVFSRQDPVFSRQDPEPNFQNTRPSVSKTLFSTEESEDDYGVEVTSSSTQKRTKKEKAYEKLIWKLQNDDDWLR